MDFHKFYVSPRDCTFMSPGMINRFPYYISFKEKYRKPLSLFKTHFINLEKFNRINSMDYSFLNFEVEDYIDFDNNISTKEIHIDNGIEYFRYSSNYHPVYKTYMENKIFNEEPQGWLYFQSNSDLVKFKILLG